MKVAVVIPVYNRKEVTLNCLKALYQDLPASFHVITVDSGSTDGTRESVRENYPDTIIIQGVPEDWWAGAVNRGIKRALEMRCQYILTYNDDNVAAPGMLQGLLKTALLHPYAIISSAVCYLDSRSRIYFAGRRRAKLTDRFIYMGLGRLYDELEKGVCEADLLHGMCTLFPVSVFQHVGLFDEQAFPHLFADDDLILRAKKHGYRLLVDLDTVVFNDHTMKGLSPYDRKPGLRQVVDFFTSRKSVFQVSTRTRFLWRHRRSVISFIITWIADYTRLLCVIFLRWILSPDSYKKLEKRYLKIRSV